MTCQKIGIGVVLCEDHKSQVDVFLDYNGLGIYTLSLEIADLVSVDCGEFLYDDVTEIVFDLFDIGTEDIGVDRWKRVVQMSK